MENTNEIPLKTIVLFSLILFPILILLWKRRTLYALSMKIPGPFALPLLGNAFDLEAFSNSKSPNPILMRLKKKYGEVYRLWLGPELNIVFSEPQDFECVYLNKCAAHKGAKYEMIAELTGNGILTSSGPFWKHNRQILNPSFNAECLRSYQTIHNEHADKMARSMDGLCGGAVVDVSVQGSRFAVGVILESLFGLPVKFWEGKFDAEARSPSKLIECFYKRMTKPWLVSDALYRLSDNKKITDAYGIIYKGFYHKMLNDRIDKMLDVKVESNSRNLENSLDVMINAFNSGNMSRKQIINEFEAIFNPGVDTIYTAISFFMLMMGMHKRCQDLAWKEIKEVFGDDTDSPVMPEHLPKLKYMDMCMREISRLFPTGCIQTRVADEDLPMKHRNLVIPTGTTIFLSSYMLHRNSKYWESPDEFVPERFTPEASAKRPHFAYAPYSGGIRTCIGKVFGFDALKIAGVHLIRNFEFHSDLKMEDVKLRSDISVRSDIGYPVKISKRNKNIKYGSVDFHYYIDNY